MSNEIATASPEQNAFELAQREAKALSRSDLVPDIYKGDKGVANCLIAINLSKRIGADALMIMQNMHVIKGRPSFSSTFLIASVNASNKFSPLRFEFRSEIGRPDFACRAWAIEKETGDRLNGTWVTWEMAKTEGWLSKKDRNGNETSKWPTMGEQMIRYRAAAFWQRVYAPEISMGLLTKEELDDIAPVTVRIIPEETKALEDALMDDDIIDVTDVDPPHTVDAEHSEDDPI